MAEVDTSWGRLFHQPRAIFADRQPDRQPAKQSVVVRLPGERVRIDMSEHRALMFPMSTTPISPALVRQSVQILNDIGFCGWIETIALADQEVHGFRSAGFGVRQSLCLLMRDLQGAPRRKSLASQSGTKLAELSHLRHPDVVAKLLRVDAFAFGEETSLDSMGLQHSLTATQQVRVCGAWLGTELLGFAITGKVGRAAYLQRLAVNPSYQGQGTGSLLCQDALRWAKRKRARRMVVNTHYENQRALDLYARHGFERAPTGLTVMGYFTGSPTPP